MVFNCHETFNIGRSQIFLRIYLIDSTLFAVQVLDLGCVLYTVDHIFMSKIIYH
ncbi:hypothetical protein Plhal304r1_c011g0041651 [Plasmopara halstedii]